MTLEHLLWLLAVLVAPLVLGGLALRKRRSVVENIQAMERTQEHEAILNALTEWLQEERIVRAMIENRVANRPGLEETFRKLASYDERKVRAVAAALLRERNVRRIIAAHLEHEHGISHREAMAPLLEWSRFEEAQSA